MIIPGRMQGVQGLEQGSHRLRHLGLLTAYWYTDLELVHYKSDSKHIRFLNYT